MTRKPPGQAAAVAGVVKWFDADEGWGVVEAPEVPGGCFVHFSNIEMPGYRQLQAGQRVLFTFEQPGFLQDGFLLSCSDGMARGVTISGMRVRPLGAVAMHNCAG